MERRILGKLEGLGINELKPSQLTALNLLNQAKDLFVVLPAGYGKSLIYQGAPFVCDGKSLTE